MGLNKLFRTPPHLLAYLPREGSSTDSHISFPDPPLMLGSIDTGRERRQVLVRMEKRASKGRKKRRAVTCLKRPHFFFPSTSHKKGRSKKDTSTRNRHMGSCKERLFFITHQLILPNLLFANFSLACVLPTSLSNSSKTCVWVSSSSPMA